MQGEWNINSKYNMGPSQAFKQHLAYLFVYILVLQNIYECFE